jgi:hypothetical protein
MYRPFANEFAPTLEIAFRQKKRRDDRSHALRGNAAPDAPRLLLGVTRSVTQCMSTQSVGTIMAHCHFHV